MYNENNSAKVTTETDSSGGNRKVEEENIKKEVIFTDESGSSVPMTQTIVSPKVEGVVVTADGAGDVNVKTNIISAVEAVTGVPAHKIQVFSAN